jgi:hypothetical protein
MLIETLGRLGVCGESVAGEFGGFKGHGAAASVGGASSCKAVLTKENDCDRGRGVPQGSSGRNGCCPKARNAAVKASAA